MAELTLEQRTLLEEVRRAKEARAGARARIEAENRTRLERGLREAEDTLNRKVREAFEAGISKRQIGRQGLGTVDPTIVNRTLEKTATEVEVAAAVASVTAPRPLRELTEDEVRERGLKPDPHAELYVELHYPGFPSRWRGPASEYPDPLTGVVVRVFGLWSVLDDPSGVFLEWELSQLEPNEGILAQILEAYASSALAAQ